ncbi:hypothetical protein HanIR_Chr02g0059841 [Helianthus annuus]|nr:hypothetical protein HanIR_Chr02g0059841 [Helianthus annuus]
MTNSDETTRFYEEHQVIVRKIYRNVDEQSRRELGRFRRNSNLRQCPSLFR